jgi:hypothetical protein
MKLYKLTYGDFFHDNMISCELYCDTFSYIEEYTIKHLGYLNIDYNNPVYETIYIDIDYNGKYINGDKYQKYKEDVIGYSRINKLNELDETI